MFLKIATEDIMPDLIVFFVPMTFFAKSAFFTSQVYLFKSVTKTDIPFTSVETAKNNYRVITKQAACFFL